MLEPTVTSSEDGRPSKQTTLCEWVEQCGESKHLSQINPIEYQEPTTLNPVVVVVVITTTSCGVVDQPEAAFRDAIIADKARFD